jgi:hypothetical protein
MFVKKNLPSCWALIRNHVEELYLFYKPVSMFIPSINTRQSRVFTPAVTNGLTFQKDQVVYISCIMLQHVRTDLYSLLAYYLQFSTNISSQDLCKQLGRGHVFANFDTALLYAPSPSPPPQELLRSFVCPASRNTGFRNARNPVQ